MDTFKIDYENLDVEAIMAQIRQRVKEKKGVVYSDADLEKLGGLELPSPVPPEQKDPDRDRIPVPEVPEPAPSRREEIAALEETIRARMEQTQFQDVQDEDFVTETLRCIGDWNINITLEDIYKSSPGAKGKIIRGIRSLTSKMFKLVMNIDVLFPQFHRQAILNQTYVRLLHTLVKELSTLYLRVGEDKTAFRNELDRIHIQLKEMDRIDDDLKRTRAELMRDITNDKNDFRRTVNSLNDEIQRLHYDIDQLKGIIEGQKQQIEYMLLRQRSLEKLAVLKEDEKSESEQKQEKLEPGRYKPSKKRKER